MAGKAQSLASEMDFMADLRGKAAGLVLAGALALVVALAFITDSNGAVWLAQVYVLAAFLVVTGTWALLKVRYRLAVWFYIACTFGVIAVAPGWIHGDGTLCLLVIPATLALFLLGFWSGAVVTGLTCVFLLAGGDLLNVTPLVPRVVAIMVVLATESLVGIALHNASEMQALASSSYRAMRDELDTVGNQRLLLKQTQEDLSQANLELARLADRQTSLRQAADDARRAKEDFVAHVSHELRTPLNMILGFTELIVRTPGMYGANLPSPLLADLDVVYRNSRHLLSLINDVLDLSRMQRGRMTLDLERCEIGDIIAEAMQIATPLFEAKGLYQRAEVPEDLSSVLCDRDRIRQVLLNLLTNAGRFVDTGGVAISARQQGDHVLISVADTGPGIAKSDSQRVFEPFQRGSDAAVRRKEGTGLGLTISKELIEMHQGRMWVESQPGVGTTFCFSLPFEAVPAGAEGFTRWVNPFQTYEARTRGSLAQVPELRRRFVVLEQGGVIQDLLAYYLDTVEIVSHPDIATAAAYLAHIPAQALIINDAAIDDHAVERRLVNLPPETPVIGCWVSGRSYVAQQLHASEYLVKPVARSALFAALSELHREIQTVLVVDDDPEDLQLFVRVLGTAEQRYRVFQASNGMQALILMRRRNPDVVLLDLIMPGMDGYQVLEEMQRDDQLRNISVIIISATDPVDTPVSSNVLQITRKGGLSGEELIACIDAVTQILAPEKPRADQAPQETQSDSRAL